MRVRILVGDCLERLRTLPEESVHCVVTSPPYWGLRDYGVAGGIGLEPTFGEHINTIVTVFREVRRVLRKDGTLWLNYGDRYHNKAGTSERGACPECGAPWTQVTERKQVNPGNRQTNGLRSMERRQESAGFEQRLETRVETLGWQPTCEHDTEPVRCKVLDPFGGAGTVGLVASRLGRDAILIELNPEYAEMAERRIHGDAPLLADVGMSA